MGQRRGWNHAGPCMEVQTQPNSVLSPSYLLQGLGGDYYSTSAGQREKMLTATQRLENSSKKLDSARQTLAQTEVGVSMRMQAHHVMPCALRWAELWRV
jgi:hypothetical protein